MSLKKQATSNPALPGFDAPAPLSSECYAGDKANPNLRQFVERHGEPYDAEHDDYAVAAFNQPITTTKATSIYLMHSYHQGKKPHDAIRQYVRHYTEPGDIVLDSFSGSGGTALASLLEGRCAIAIDRSPAATFVSKNYCTPVDTAALRAAFGRVKQRVQPELEWLYGTKCDRCGGKAIVAYTVYSQVFQCPRCLKKVPLFDCPQAEGQTATGAAKSVRVCPACNAKGHHEEISTSSDAFGHVPVLQSYLCQNGCSPARGERKHCDSDARKRQAFQDFDLGKLAEIDSKPVPYWYPANKMMNIEDDSLPWGAEWRPGRNFRSVAELYTRRNLWAIAAIRAAILSDNSPCRDLLLFALNAVTLNCSRMYRYRESLKGGFQQGTYYIPQESQIINVFRAFCDKVEDLCRAAKDMPVGGDFIVSTQSACNLSGIPSDSVDYVFTDPPYSDRVQYGELNFIWEAWLGLDTNWHDDEIIVNDVRGKTEADWAAMMRSAMSECYRVLKPGRWLSLCYHDTSEGTWQLVQDIMAEVGFVVDKTDSTVFIDTGQKSFNQLMADKATKRDLVLNFRKPKPGETEMVIPADADALTFQELGCQIIRGYLTIHPGSPKDRVYDELVSHMVRKGQMEAHDFNGLLATVAEEVKETAHNHGKGGLVISRWYLKETADQIDKAEQDKEDAAAQRLEKCIREYRKKHPEEEGVHYSDLFEAYLPVREKPRRLLADWLPEYFFKTTDGTWRPPLDEHERQQKALLREVGTLRRMKRFANALIDGVPIRDQDRPANDRTLAEWIRQCRRAGLYEQGRALFEKGGLIMGNLNEEEQIAVEDDYRICVKRKGEGEMEPKSRGRKKS